MTPVIPLRIDLMGVGVGIEEELKSILETENKFRYSPGPEEVVITSNKELTPIRIIHSGDIHVIGVPKEVAERIARSRPSCVQCANPIPPGRPGRKCKTCREGQ